MINLAREEAQQVLDALEWFERRYEFAGLIFSKQAIEILRARLALHDMNEAAEKNGEPL